MKFLLVKKKFDQTFTMAMLMQYIDNLFRVYSLDF